jgi:hypothetical protein
LASRESRLAETIFNIYCISANGNGVTLSHCIVLVGTEMTRRKSDEETKALESKELFLRNGYIVIPDFLTLNQLNALRKECRILYDQTPPQTLVDLVRLSGYVYTLLILMRKYRDVYWISLHLLT